MKNNNEQQMEIDASELPVIGAVSVLRQRGYGTIADLDDEAPADVHELQRLIAWRDYEPILSLRGRNGRAGNIALTPDGEIDWGRISPITASRRRLKPIAVRRGDVSELRERLASTVRMANLLRARVPGTAKYLVLKYVQMGIVPIEEITNKDMRVLAQLDAKMRRLTQRIEEGCGRPIVREVPEPHAEALVRTRHE